MKKLAKKLLCLTAVLALTLSLFTGCKSKNEKTLFEYAGQEVTFQEAHVYARIMQYQAEAQRQRYQPVKTDQSFSSTRRRLQREVNKI